MDAALFTSVRSFRELPNVLLRTTNEICTGRSGLLAAGILVVVLCLAGRVRAQEQPSKLPPAKEQSLATRDGVQLAATYYPGTKGKETVPVMLVHGEDENRHDFNTLALVLQEAGHAVIAFDLRGHGDSTTVTGLKRKLEADKMPPGQYQQMTQDLEAVKSFLITEHNEGLLNIDRLCVVGSKMGTVVAVVWTAIDWEWPVLPTGKQGQDVKALVLISPVERYKSLRMSKALATPAIRKEVSFYIVMGANGEAQLKNSQRLYDSLARYREMPEPDDPDAQEKQTLFFDDRLETDLQGTKLFSEASLKLEATIAEFINLRVASKPVAWKLRKKPI